MRPLFTLQLHHDERDGVSNHRATVVWLNRMFRHRSKKTSKLRVTGLCAGNSPVTREFPAQKSSNAENLSIWWRHHGTWIEQRYTQWTEFCEFRDKFYWHLISLFDLHTGITRAIKAIFDVVQLNHVLQSYVWNKCSKLLVLLYYFDNTIFQQVDR